MFRTRKEPDPLRGKRRHLAEQERRLAEQMSQLNDKLARGGEDIPRANQPPVWRLEEDAPSESRRQEPNVTGKRVLARQRRRDMLVFFLMIGALIVVILLVLELAHSHGTGTLPGA